VRYVVKPPDSGVGIAERIVTVTATATIIEANGTTREIAPIVRQKSTVLRKPEVQALNRWYREQYNSPDDIATQAERPDIDRMTLHASKATGDAGLLVELWEHAANWRRELTDAELHAALGNLIPVGHSVTAASASDRALAEERALAQQQQQEEEEEDEEDEEDEDAASEESESGCESEGDGHDGARDSEDSVEAVPMDWEGWEQA